MINRYRSIVLTLMLQSGLVSAVCVPAGGDGELAFESCSESEISLSIPSLARVALLDQFTLGVFDYETPPQATDDFCIWYNTEQFSMTVNSANSNGENTFALLGSNTTERIPYQLTWYDRTGAVGEQIDLSNQENLPQDQLVLFQRPTDAGCTTDNTSINITVPLENLEGKPEDSYSDTLTVTVSVQ